LARVVIMGVVSFFPRSKLVQPADFDYTSAIPSDLFGLLYMLNRIKMRKTQPAICNLQSEIALGRIRKLWRIPCWDALYEP